MAAISILGPLLLKIIRYRWPTYSSTIVMGQDFVHLILLVPTCIIGGILKLKGNARSIFFLITLGPYLIYQFPLRAITPEWSHPDYAGISATSQNYFWLSLIVGAGGLIILADSLSKLNTLSISSKKLNTIKIIVFYLILFVLIIAALWISQILSAIADPWTNKSYLRAPTVFWWIRIFDLSILIPLVLISIYAFVFRRNNGGYGMLLLGTGTLMLAFPVIGGSLLFTYFLVPGETKIQELIFFLAMCIPIWPTYIHLVRQNNGNNHSNGAGHTLRLA